MLGSQNLKGLQTIIERMLLQNCGSHTREEKVLIRSIPVGLKIAAELILGYFG